MLCNATSQFPAFRGCVRRKGVARSWRTVIKLAGYTHGRCPCHFRHLFWLASVFVHVISASASLHYSRRLEWSVFRIQLSESLRLPWYVLVRIDDLLLDAITWRNLLTRNLHLRPYVPKALQRFWLSPDSGSICMHSGHRIRGALSAGNTIASTGICTGVSDHHFLCSRCHAPAATVMPPVNVLFSEERTHRDVVWQSFPLRDKCYNSASQRLADLFFSAVLRYAHSTNQINVLLLSNLERPANLKQLPRLLFVYRDGCQPKSLSFPDRKPIDGVMFNRA